MVFNSCSHLLSSFLCLILPGTFCCAPTVFLGLSSYVRCPASCASPTVFLGLLSSCVMFILVWTSYHPS
ncbi:hypothetical protein B0H14DRAFT_2731563 [Mycena olivaceomarginata]|nr:hypothetical protein B0H14DRAFT_2731563 [Mycena olivaceomarginata]